MKTLKISSVAIQLLALALTLTACGQAPEPQSTEPQQGGSAQPQGSVVAYEGARVIVGDGSVIENAVFTVENDRFGVVGAAAEVSVPAGATRVDLSGMTVMPTIVDAHTHLSTTREALINDLERRAYLGVGGAVSLGADGEGAPLEVRDEVIPGAARYRSAGLGITAPEPGRRQVHWVTTEEDAREAVRAEAARNVDVIKIWVDDRGGQYDKLTPELYGAIIDEAHQHDIRVTAHIFSLEDAKGLVLAGIDMFAHGVRDRDIDDEFVELVEERPDLILVPNLPDRGVQRDLSWLTGLMPAEELVELGSSFTEDPEAQRAFGIQARNLARLSDEGMRIAFGTDGNRPWEPHLEMEDMVVAGMDPADVIVAATRNAAEAAGMTDTGIIEAGKSADFIVLRANPLQNITNTRRIESVYLRGQEVDRAGIRAQWVAN